MILVAGSDGLIPIFGKPPQGAPSPSRSLLVETHTVPAGSHRPVSAVSQVVTLCLEPTTVACALEDGSVMRVRLERGSVHVMMREGARAVSVERETRVVAVSPSDDLLRDAADAAGRSDITIQPVARLDGSPLTPLLEMVGDQRAAGWPSGRLFVDGVALSIAAHLVASHVVPGTIDTRRDVLSAAMLRRVVDFVDASLGSALGLADLAECAGLSRAHFSKRFKATTNLTPHQFVLRARVARCKQLLVSTRLPVGEIALMGGFTTQQHMSTVFRRLVGVTPTEYRDSA